MAEKTVHAILKWTLGHGGKLYGPSVNRGTAEEPDWTTVEIPEEMARSLPEDAIQKSARKSRGTDGGGNKGSGGNKSGPERDNKASEESPDSDNTGENNDGDKGASKEKSSKKQSERLSDRPKRTRRH